MVELIHKFLNLTAPTFTIFCLFVFYPPFLFFKFFKSILRIFFSENLAGKVVLITGASSGIGENLAYEYANRGACLALVARREEQLREVVENATSIGSPDVLMILGDVSKVEDCKRIIDETVDHFGRLDHLVNNAGIGSVAMFEEITDITAFKTLMDTNFWGSVYTTRFAVPHLRNSNGKIVVLSSSAAWLPVPRMSIYNATKAALLIMFETLRVELGPDVKVTIATPGFIESELTQGKFLNSEGQTVFEPDLSDVQLSLTPMRSVRSCAKAIVSGTARGERHVTDPHWFKQSYVWKVICPEVIETCYRPFYMTRPGVPATEALSKKIVDLAGVQSRSYQASDQDKLD